MSPRNRLQSRAPVKDACKARSAGADHRALFNKPRSSEGEETRDEASMRRWQHLVRGPDKQSLFLPFPDAPRGDAASRRADLAVPAAIQPKCPPKELLLQGEPRSFRVHRARLFWPARILRSLRSGLSRCGMAHDTARGFAKSLSTHR
jgi:hypothetical protein